MTNTTNSAVEAFDGANGDLIASNVITGDDAQNTIGAIYLHGSDNTAISNNEITNTTGAGIGLSDFYGPGSTATENNDDTVSGNLLDQIDTQSGDSGAIYILGRSQEPSSGDLVTMNFIGPTGSAGAQSIGIYLDDNASGVTVTKNIVQGTPALDADFEIHGGANNTISGNIFDAGTGDTLFGLSQSDQPDQAPQGAFTQLTNDTVSGNVFTSESASPRTPAFSNLTGGIGDVSISGNDFWSFAGAPLGVAGSGANGDSAPQFVQPASQAALTPTQYAAYAGDGINFAAIDTAAIGPAPTGPHPY
jgi:hypothetical protein